MSDVPFDVSRGHRWFAAELNNRAWDLVEQSTRTSAETDEMIDAAHAARLHWRPVGTAINELRALCLLATAYSAAGRPEAACRYAEACLAQSDQVGDEQSVFDRASAVGCAANAFAVAGDLPRARQYHDQVVRLAAALDHPDEIRQIDQLYPAPPA